ncbi:MAG: hypothetical protein H6R17_4272 [Proteobacteria bacterium]|nr:hypothetical protein [Pseudomonadota bacterium]
MKSHPTRQTDQTGIMLLEALIAILIFSLGILALVALQATSIKLTGDAKYRTDATLLANRLIGQMWVASGNLAALKADFEPPSGAACSGSVSSGAAYCAWLADVSAGSGLPGVVATGTAPTLPQVTVDLTPTAAPTSAQVTITLFWRTPEMNGNDRHRHIVTTQIAKNL